MKRFTDTEKWSDPFYRGLSLEMKLVFQYIQDQVDRSGFWFPEWDVAAVRLGFTVDPETVLRDLKIHVRAMADGTWQLITHVQTQYPRGLSDSNNYHKAIRRDLLQKEAAEKESRGFCVPTFIPLPDPPKGGSKAPAVTHKQDSPGGLGVGVGVAVGVSDGPPPEVDQGGAGGTRPAGETPAVKIIGDVLREFEKQGASQSGDVPIFTATALCDGFERHGGGGLRKAVQEYIRRRRAQRKGPSLKHFADHLDEYAPPRSRPACRHRWTDFFEPATEFQYGGRVAMRKCQECKRREPKHGTRAASLQQQQHKHDWRDGLEGLQGQFKEMAERNGLGEKQQCRLCGEMRVKQLEA